MKRNYIYLTNVKIEQDLRQLICAISVIEHENGDKVSDLQLVADDMTGLWTVRFTSKIVHQAEYTVDI